jgi:hypothetical protein
LSRLADVVFDKEKGGKVRAKKEGKNQMNNDRFKRIEPVCRFGPGGEFMSFWPENSLEFSSRQSWPNSLSKVLGSIARIISTKLGQQQLCADVTIENICQQAEEGSEHKEQTHNAKPNPKPDKSSYTPPNAVIRSNRKFPGQPMLFADDRGACRRTNNKPKHHIRAYRGTPKKRAAFDIARQSTLFEADFKSQKIA